MRVECGSNASGMRVKRQWNEGGLRDKRQWNEGGMRVKRQWNEGGMRVEREWNEGQTTTPRDPRPLYATPIFFLATPNGVVTPGLGTAVLDSVLCMFPKKKSSL